MDIFSIHLDPPFIYTALLRKKRNGIQIHDLKVDPQAQSSSDPISPQCKTALHSDFRKTSHYIEHFKGRIASGIPAKDFLMRSVELKIANSRHVEEAIAFQSEATGHFTPGEILSVPLIEKKEKGDTEALLFTVPREVLKKHLLELEKLEIDPDSVSTVPLALCHFIRWRFPKLLDALIIDLGSSEITCVLMEQGKLKKAHAISEGIETLLAALLEDRKKVLLKQEIEGAAKQIDLMLLKPSANPRLMANLNKLRQTIGKILFSFCRKEAKPVIFTGRTDTFIHLREFLVDPLENDWTLTPEEQKFAIAIGLGLEQFSLLPLQLRREEFFPRKNWNRMGFYALLFLSASLLFSVGLLGLGNQLSFSRKAKMGQFLGISGKENLEEKIDRWIVSIEKSNKEYTYILQAPKVVEVFSWISSHPLLEMLKKEGDPIDIREIQYQLITLPQIHSLKEPYLAKVEIEFQFKSAMNARKFHEALRQGDDLVNPNLEIIWDALNEGYRVSFFLKNRSPYVS